jgi:hypothetical protein
MKDATFKDPTTFAVLVVGVVGLVTCERLVAPLIGDAQAAPQSAVQTATERPSPGAV